jgi:hypothetical protein
MYFKLTLTMSKHHCGICNVISEIYVTRALQVQPPNYRQNIHITCKHFLQSTASCAVSYGQVLRRRRHLLPE